MNMARFANNLIKKLSQQESPLGCSHCFSGILKVLSTYSYPNSTFKCRSMLQMKLK